MDDNPKIIGVPVKEGWEFRFFGSEPRLSEVVALYEELGFQTTVVKASPDNCDGCAECFTDLNNPVMIVYTRRMDSGPSRPECPVRPLIPISFQTVIIQ